MEIKRVGIITSGGDCGGLNAVIRGAAELGNHLGIESVIIPNGYAGLYNLVDFETGELVALDPVRLGAISAVAAGSEAGHSRVKVSKIKDDGKYERIIAGLSKHSIDALIISGGDDTGSVAADLSNKDIKVVHVPKTMDFDLQPYSVGVDSTMNRIGEIGRDIITTARTHNRVIILEVFGRYVGHSAFRGGVAGDADCILIPEITPDFNAVYEHLFSRYKKRLEVSDVAATWYLIVAAEAMRGNPDAGDKVNEEGFLVDTSKAPDAFGHYPLVGAGKKVEDEIKRRMKADPRMKALMEKTHLYVPGQYEIPEVRAIRPTHIVRCGSSSAYDVNFGRQAGAGAMQLLKEGVYGETVCGFNRGVIQHMPISEAIKRRAVDLRDVELYEAMGVCFGREAKEYQQPSLVEVKSIARHL